MREIKFRAWDKGKMSGPVGMLLTDFSEWIKNLSSEADIEQFTGLRDRNGEEIYENDVVTQYHGSEWELTMIVKWRDGKCGFWLYKNHTGPHLDFGEHREKLTIIGNIHENPELLK